MKEIKLLMEHIEDELEDAHTYAELAVEYKHDDPELADLFYRAERGGNEPHERPAQGRSFPHRGIPQAEG